MCVYLCGGFRDLWGVHVQYVGNEMRGIASGGGRCVS